MAEGLRHPAAFDVRNDRTGSKHPERAADLPLYDRDLQQTRKEIDMSVTRSHMSTAKKNSPF